MTKRKIDPILDQVVVRTFKPDEMSKGGIFLPGRAQENKIEGEVVAVGPGAYAPDTGKQIPMCVKVGDVVVYEKYAGTEIKIDDVELLVLRQNAILTRLIDVEEEAPVG